MAKFRVTVVRQAEVWDMFTITAKSKAEAEERAREKTDDMCFDAWRLGGLFGEPYVWARKWRKFRGKIKRPAPGGIDTLLKMKHFP